MDELQGLGQEFDPRHSNQYRVKIKERQLTQCVVASTLCQRCGQSSNPASQHGVFKGRVLAEKWVQGAQFVVH